MISFTIPGEPVAFARAGANGAQRFTPKRQRDFMALVRLAAAKAMEGQAIMEGAVSLMVRAVYLVPKSWSKAKAAGANWRASKPDADNLAKIISDAMNTVVFIDDAQIANLTVQKVYGPIAGVTVSVVRLDDEAQTNPTVKQVLASDRGAATAGASVPANSAA